MRKNRKLALDVDALRVESFPTAEEGGERGTVRGLESLFRCTGDTCGQPTCLGYLTCGCGCSETDGYAVCKSCGPSCYE